MLEPKAPPARNDPNTGSLAPGVKRRVKKKKKKQYLPYLQFLGLWPQSGKQGFTAKHEKK